MGKKCLFFMTLVLAASTTFAQLSTRENDQTHEKMGARPQQGDMALNFAFPLSGSSSLASFNIGNSLNLGDILTFKYYLTNKNVFRFGIKLYADNSKSSGTVLDDAQHTLNPTDVSQNSFQSVNRLYVIAPGIEHHFLNSNIFDVYSGLDLFLGFGRNKSYYDYTYKNGDVDNTDMSSPNTTIGLGGVVGFNIFVAHLPIAIGLEYGLNAKWAFDGKTAVTVKETTSTTNYSTTYYTQKTDPFGNKDVTDYASLSKRQFDMNTNSDLRLVLNIYFSR